MTPLVKVNIPTNSSVGGSVVKQLVGARPRDVFSGVGESLLFAEWETGLAWWIVGILSAWAGRLGCFEFVFPEFFALGL